MRKITIVILLVFLTLQINAKEAILLIGGIFGTQNKMEKLQNSFKEDGQFDVFTCYHYLSRKDLEISYANMKHFLENLDLEIYEKVHIFTHIFGGRLLIRYFNKNEIPNLASIVFDRSPLEEELAIAAREYNGDLALIFFGGRNLLSFSQMEHYQLPEKLKRVKVGIIIETKAIFLCYLYRQQIKSNQPSFDPDMILNHWDDYFYIELHHKQMYSRFERFVPEVLLFFKTGQFSQDVNRTPGDFLNEF